MSNINSVDVENDILAMAGYWEPQSFMIRASRAHHGLEQDEYPYSEEMAKKLSEIGINTVVWHYYKGLGIETEDEEMKKTAKFFKYCEKHGLRKGVYINAGSIFADTFIAENPEAADWMSIDQWGKNINIVSFIVAITGGGLVRATKNLDNTLDGRPSRP